MQFIFLTVHYNTNSSIKSYLESINNLVIDADDTIKVVIVDNASRKEEVEQVKKNVNESSLNTQLILSENNNGYFKGLNIGIDAIKPELSDSYYILVGNNDVLYSNDFLQKLKHIALPEGTMVLAPNIKNTTGYYENPHEVNRISKSRLFIYDLYYSNYIFGTFFLKMHKLIGKKIIFRKRIDNRMIEPVEGKDICMCIGSQFILTSYFFDKCDRLLDRVFLWCEEVFLSYQVREAKGRMIFFPELKMFHIEHLSTNQFPTRKKYEMMRKSYWTARKYF